MKTRMLWSDLPDEITDEVERVLGGAVVEAASQAEGFSPGSADRVVTEHGVRAFVKAVPHSLNPDAHALHAQEARVMRLIPAGVNAPELLGSITTDAWSVLMLQDIEGVHPGGAGDGSDVVAVLDAFATFPRLDGEALTALRAAEDEFRADADSWRTIAEQAIEVPEWAVRHHDCLRAAGERVLDAVAGEYLQHLDGRADNVLLDAQGTAWVIDWPWAVAGARWLDGLFYLLDVRMRGEDIDVEVVLNQHPLFVDVAADDIDAALAAVTGQFFIKAQLPAPPGMPTLRDFQYREAIAGMEWLQQRWG